ncbi:MAG: trigger factor [Myxococcota bacterium]
MKVDVETVGFQKRLSIRVPPDKVRSQLDEAYRRLASQVRLAGFRPGRAPRKVLEAKFSDRVQADVANDLIRQGYLSAITEHEIKPVSEPNLTETSQVDEPEGFAFTIMVDVKPQIELQQWTELEVVYPTVEVSDDEVDAAVRARLEGQARVEEVTDRPVEKGDMALIELTAKEGDEEVVQDSTMVRTEGDPYYPGIEALIVGMSVGEERSGEVTFPDDARIEAVAGRTLAVTVKLLTIQAYKVPEATDEIAETLGYEGGVDGMRSAITAQLRSGRDEMARNQARANLLEAIIAANPFEVPAGMVEGSLKMLMDELRMQQARRTGRDPRSIGFSNAQVEDLRMRSNFAAKAGLILEWVSKKEGIEVEDGDVEARFAQMAAEMGQTVEALRGRFRQEDTSELRERILEEKALDWLLERSNLVPPAPGAPPTQPPPKAKAAAEAESEAPSDGPAVLEGKVDDLAGRAGLRRPRRRASMRSSRPRRPAATGRALSQPSRRGARTWRRADAGLLPRSALAGPGGCRGGEPTAPSRVARRPERRAG